MANVNAPEILEPMVKLAPRLPLAGNELNLKITVLLPENDAPEKNVRIELERQ